MPCGIGLRFHSTVQHRLTAPFLRSQVLNTVIVMDDRWT